MKPSHAWTVAAAIGCLLAATACDSPGPAGPTAPTPAAGPNVPPQVSAAIATDHGPSRLIVGPDAVYVGNHRGGSVQRIDPATNRVTGTMLVGGQLELALDADPVDPLWACTNTDGVLHQLDLGSGRLTAAVPAGCNGGWRTVIDGHVWAVSGGETPELRVLDARTAEVLRTMPVDVFSGAPVGAGGRVFIGSGASGVTLAFTSATAAPAEIAVETPWLVQAGGKLYRVPMDGTLAELDPVTLAVVRTYAVPAHRDGDPTLVADDAGHLYYRPDKTNVYRVDLASGTVEPFLQLPWQETPTGMAWGFKSLWVTNFNQDTIWRKAR